MANVAIIIARGGSKRIPRKNIKDFLGKPIIAYSIETTLRSNLFDYVMVSTDDDEIAQVATKYGAQVPFMRSKKTSDDHSTTADVIIEVLDSLKNINKQFENVCCIYPTAPFISLENLTKSYQKLIDQKLDTVFPVCKFSSAIQRALIIDENEKLKMISPETMNVRSQDLTPAYYDAGQFYWLRTETFQLNKKIYSDNSGSIILNEMEVQDIDNLMDWELAQLKFKLINKTKDGL